MIEFTSKSIGIDEEPRWVKNQFLVSEACPHRVLSDDRYFVTIPDSFYISQLSREHFNELDDLKINPDGEEMRKSGCGVACLYMALQTLVEERGKEVCPTVGFLALQLLCFHRNDLKDEVSGVVKTGTPVFNSSRGWYHDAFAYYVSSEIGIGSYRKASLALEDIVCELCDMRKNGRVGVAIVSVDNKYWRRQDEPESSSTHMVLMHGYQTNSDALVESILVTDPYTRCGPKINEWILVDDKINKSVVGGVIFVYKDGII